MRQSDKSPVGITGTPLVDLALARSFSQCNDHTRRGRDQEAFYLLS